MFIDLQDRIKALNCYRSVDIFSLSSLERFKNENCTDLIKTFYQTWILYIIETSRFYNESRLIFKMIDEKETKLDDDSRL